MSSQLFTAAIAALMNCASPALAQALKHIGEEALISAAIDERGITFQVPTGGCTAKENFGLETVTPNPLTVRLVRLRPDYCEARVPQGVKIKFTYAEIGAGPKLSTQEQKALVILNSSK